MASTVTVDFNANLARFSSAIDKATADLNKFQSNTARISANIGKSLGALGIGFSVTGLATFVKDSIDAADRINDLSKSTGLAVEQLAGLDLAARQSGADLGSIAESINKLSTNIGKNGDKFKQLGITAKDPLEAFKQLSDIFVSIEDPQLRAALGAEALGKSWQGAAPLLAEGSKNIQTMVDRGTKLSGITKENAEKAAEFNSKLDELAVLSKGAALPLLPVLTSIAKLFNDATKEADLYTTSLAKLKLIATAAAPGVFAPFTLDTTDESKQSSSGKIRFQNSVRLAQEAVQRVEDFVGEGKGNNNGGRNSRVERINAEFEAATRFIEAIQKEAETLGFSNIQLKEYEAAHLKLTPAQKAVFSSSLKQIEAFEEEQKRLDRLTESYENHQRVMDDFFNRELEGLEQDSADEAETTKNFERSAQAVREMLDPTIGLYNKIGEIQGLVSCGLLTNEEGEAAIKKIEEDFAKLNKTGQDTADNFTKFFEEAAKNMQDSMSNFFFDAMQGQLNDLGASFKQTIDRMVANIAAAQAATQLFGEDFAKGKSTELGGFVGNVFSKAGDFFDGLFNADGNAFNSAGLIPFANGGIVSAATPFAFGGGRLGVMGEAGPEAILPLKRGANGKLGVQGGSGIVINGPLVSVQATDADSFRRSDAQIASQMQRALSRARRVT